MTISPFIKPEYSRKQVQRAGKMLCDGQLLAADYTQSMNVLSNWRGAHRYILSIYNNRFRQMLKRHGIEAIVSSRLKRTPSIIAKLKRFPSMNLARMGDIAGMRIVVKTPANLYKLIELLEKGKTATETQRDRIKNYIAEPKITGYRSIHYPLKYSGADQSAHDGLSMELQIRTELQHAWATSVEIIDAFLGKSLKTTLVTEGDKHAEFFRYASSIMADREFLPRIQKHTALTSTELIQKLLKLDSELRVADNLDAFRIAIPDQPSKQKSHYRILILDRKSKNIAIHIYPEKKFDEANSEYAELEMKYKEDPAMDIVFVQAGTMEEVKRAYPNYFGEADTMIKLVRDLRKN
jgi:ppGpp synthetase/RelA/SpoT-type nucleotidyltranferase